METKLIIQSIIQAIDLEPSSVKQSVVYYIKSLEELTKELTNITHNWNLANSPSLLKVLGLGHKSLESLERIFGNIAKQNNEKHDLEQNQNKNKNKITKKNKKKKDNKSIPLEPNSKVTQEQKENYQKQQQEIQEHKKKHEKVNQEYEGKLDKESNTIEEEEIELQNNQQVQQHQKFLQQQQQQQQQQIRPKKEKSEELIKKEKELRDEYLKKQNFLLTTTEKQMNKCKDQSQKHSIKLKAFRDFHQNEKSYYNKLKRLRLESSGELEEITTTKTTKFSKKELQKKDKEWDKILIKQPKNVEAMNTHLSLIFNCEDHLLGKNQKKFVQEFNKTYSLESNKFNTEDSSEEILTFLGMASSYFEKKFKSFRNESTKKRVYTIMEGLLFKQLDVIHILYQNKYHVENRNFHLKALERKDETFDDFGVVKFMWLDPNIDPFEKKTQNRIQQTEEKKEIEEIGQKNEKEIIDENLDQKEEIDQKDNLMEFDDIDEDEFAKLGIDESLLEQELEGFLFDDEDDNKRDDQDDENIEIEDQLQEQEQEQEQEKEKEQKQEQEQKKEKGKGKENKIEEQKQKEEQKINPYQDIIEDLHLIGEQKSPTQKRKLLVGCTSKIYQRVTNFYKGWNLKQDQIAIGADELMPLIIFLILKADVPNFFSQIQFIQELSDEDSMMGRSGYTFASFCSATHLALELKSKKEKKLKK
ncbi:hypothetical protein M0812_20989 [Anaeramoeba flamelloides]|uniref:VPS9 domain-containing protein n=1 Tax=Anaeramoeba flamelloides TaxID=1746091 RepID=A0AAV7YRD8_9EUKA|nr:hypothetical protein M0812_20989 [Anaeramoeba flamelloides]